MATIRDITFAISDTSDVSEIFPFLVWAAFGRKGYPYSILGVYFLVSGLVTIYTLISAEKGQNNMIAYHFLAFWEIVMVYIFYTGLHLHKVRKSIILILIFFYAANSLFFRSVLAFNPETWTLSTILVIFIGLTHYYRIYKNDDDLTALETRPDFVITAGWLIYSSGSLFNFLMGTDILTGNPDGFFKNAWIFECISNILKNILMCYGFWLTKRECQKQLI